MQVMEVLLMLDLSLSLGYIANNVYFPYFFSLSWQTFSPSQRSSDIQSVINEVLAWKSVGTGRKNPGENLDWRRYARFGLAVLSLKDLPFQS